MCDLGTNPWLPALTENSAAPAPPDALEREGILTTGAVHPQEGVPPVEANLNLRTWRTDHAPLFVVGVHGGAGESTLSGLVMGAKGTGHRWPATDHTPAVLLCARTSYAGLSAAQRAARAWAAGQTPSLRLLGIVFIADAPGKLPRPLAEFRQLIAGGVPHHWLLDWHEPFRLGDGASPAPRSFRRSLAEINTLVERTNQ